MLSEILQLSRKNMEKIFKIKLKLNDESFEINLRLLQKIAEKIFKTK